MKKIYLDELQSLGSQLSTSFPGSLILPPRARDPGNEVGQLNLKINLLFVLHENAFLIPRDSICYYGSCICFELKRCKTERAYFASISLVLHSRVCIYEHFPLL